MYDGRTIAIHRRTALAETINRHYEAEVIHCCRSWSNREAVELAIYGFDRRRLFVYVGHLPPAEGEAINYADYLRVRYPGVARTNQPAEYAPGR